MVFPPSFLYAIFELHGQDKGAAHWKVRQAGINLSKIHVWWSRYCLDELYIQSLKVFQQ